MDIAPILAAPFVIQLHLATALGALALGGVQVAGVRLGRTTHRVLGWAFVVLISITTVAAFFIRRPDGGFSIIHIFVPITILGVSTAMISILRGDVRRHRSGMRWFYFSGLCVAGALAFLPHRVLYVALFS